MTIGQLTVYQEDINLCTLAQLTVQQEDIIHLLDRVQPDI